MERIHFGLLGAGGFAREVMPYAKESAALALSLTSSNIDVYFVETWEPKKKATNGYPLISLEEFSRLPGRRYFNVAVGDGNDRKAMVDQVGSDARSLSLYAPQAIIMDCNEIGEGAVLCPNKIITSNVSIGKYFHCNIYSYVAHDCVIGDYFTFAPGVRCNGRVHIENYAYIGTNAILRQGSSDKPLRIDRGAVIGMGAVVTRDVPPGVTVVGNPARVLEKRQVCVP